VIADGPPSKPLDDFLERLFAGEDLDGEEFLRTEPGLSDQERELVRALCRARAAPAEDVQDVAGPLPFARIGPYKLGARIGTGGMGAVFAAEDEVLGREVAVKILGPDLAGSGERAERFLREVRAVAKLRHPNIVSVHAAGEQGGLRYMAMELVPGSSLQELMATTAAAGGKLPASDVVRWGIEIARALQAAHDAGIVHRDVKPSNVRVTPEGRAVLLDFGLARDLSDLTLTETGAFRGSPQYASPEQVGLAGVPIDERTDVYSLAATLYEALTGVALFRAETREQLFHQILDREPVPLRRIDPSLPRDLETVVLAALEKDPARRHATAGALADDLLAVQEHRPVSLRPLSAFGRFSRWARRKPAKAALVVALGVGIPLVAGLAGTLLSNLPRIEKGTEAERIEDLERLLAQGFIELSEGDPAVAEGIFAETLRKHPGSVEAKAGLALAHVEQNDPAAALALLDSLSDAERAGSWVERVRRIARRRGGLRADTRASDAGPATPIGAVDHFLAGIMDLAEVHGQTHFAASDKTKNAVRTVAARAHENLRQAVLQSRTASPIYHYELGHAAWHAHLDREAREAAAAIERLWPDSPESTFAIGRALLHADRNQALATFERAARNPPRTLHARSLVVDHLCEGGTPGQAAVALEFARETAAAAPADSRIRNSLGVALRANGDYAGALAAFEEATRLSDGFAPAQFNVFAERMRAGDARGALDVTDEIVRLRPRSFDGWHARAIALSGLGRVDEAIVAFEHALELDPESARGRYNYGRELLKRGEFSKALAELQRGHELGSRNPDWSSPSAKWVEQAKQLVGLEKRMDAVRAGDGKPPTPAEKVRLARAICRPKGLFAEAAALLAAAIESDARLASPAVVLEAATAAAAAGLGRGRDAPPAASARRALRDSAHAWMAQEMANCEELLAADPSQRAAVLARLAPWESDPSLKALEPPARPADLDDGEAAEWAASWKRLKRLLAPQ
jgi:serine/threonine protein kinase/predicted Zn-dependent protease